jgi:tripartite-type tricarboxylate transporter receptor subunit TctC
MFKEGAERMPRHKLGVFLLLAPMTVTGVITESTSPARAYPDRPINMIVPWGVGGGGDRVGRVIAGLLSSRHGVSVPVINVTGASGQVGLNKVLGEPPDGYNIIEITSDTYILFARANSRFKVTDFDPIAVVDQQPSGFFVRYENAWKTWNDVLSAAKTKSVTIAGSGIGTQSDVTVNYFNKDLGLKLVSIPFDDPGMRWSAVLGQHADLLYAQFGDLDAYLSSKKLRPVLAFADKRLPNYPEIPTDKELGYNADIMHFRAFAVRNGTPDEIYNALVSAMNDMSHSLEYKRMLEEEAALPDSFVPGQKAQQYVQTWVTGVRSLTKNAK